MPNIAIKAENLSKAYQLGEIGTGTISRDLERWYARIRGKEDPFLRIGEANDRSTKGNSDIVWSLKDINFEIEQGDAVGIIGRNGAGKSTLLKVLSRVTSPTSGRITGKGRIASLLEVGTGFHPELTGRENIYLNGAILGMRKKEITRKFDEIVDFAGVERYIDTPVKRYSSGMYVRLAFAVAAHLESEILIVDEVLAVGDAEFQKKCLGKMGEVSKGEGRTVLFVSHNMGSVESLCNTGLILNNGKIQTKGLIKDVILQYINTGNRNSNLLTPNLERRIYFHSVILKKHKGKATNHFSTDNEIEISVRLIVKNYLLGSYFLLFIRDEYDKRLCCIEQHIEQNSNDNEYKIVFPAEFLMPGNYNIEIGILNSISEYIDYHENICPFEIIYGSTPLLKYGDRHLGIVFPKYELKID